MQTLGGFGKTQIKSSTPGRICDCWERRILETLSRRYSSSGRTTQQVWQLIDITFLVLVWGQWNNLLITMTFDEGFHPRKRFIDSRTHKFPSAWKFCFHFKLYCELISTLNFHPFKHQNHSFEPGHLWAQSKNKTRLWTTGLWPDPGSCKATCLFQSQQILSSTVHVPY